MAQALDHSERAAYYIPSMHPFVDSEAVRQSIHEREDVYPVAQDYADLLPRGVLLFVIWKESCATRSGANQLICKARNRRRLQQGAKRLFIRGTIEEA